MEENKYRKETKYFCSYCKIFVQNNKISKTTHEQGPGHKNAVARFLRNVHKTQDRTEREKVKNGKMLEEVEYKANKSMGIISTSTASKPAPSAGAKVNTLEAPRKVNAELYGYGNTDGSTAPPVYVPFNPAEFIATQAFIDANVPTIGVGKIGEWETYTEPTTQPLEGPLQDDEDDDGLAIKVKRGQVNEFLDEDEGVTKADVTGFIIKQKRMLDVEDDVDDQAEDEEIGFKKRKGKSGNARKKL